MFFKKDKSADASNAGSEQAELSKEQVFEFPKGDGFALCAEVRDRGRRLSHVVRLDSSCCLEIYRVKSGMISRRASVRLSENQVDEINRQLLNIFETEASGEGVQELQATGELGLITDSARLFAPILDISWRFDTEIRTRISDVNPEGRCEELLDKMVRKVSPSTILFGDSPVSSSDN